VRSPTAGSSNTVVVRKYWGADDARAVVEQWRASGLPLNEFARQHGIHPRRLGRWSRRLKGESAAAAASGFHPARIVRGAAYSDDARIEIVLANECCVRVAPGFAAEDLRLVLGVLAMGAWC
jgi:transposase-like protein